MDWGCDSTAATGGAGSCSLTVGKQLIASCFATTCTDASFLLETTVDDGRMVEVDFLVSFLAGRRMEPEFAVEVDSMLQAVSPQFVAVRTVSAAAEAESTPPQIVFLSSPSSLGPMTKRLSVRVGGRIREATSDSRTVDDGSALLLLIVVVFTANDKTL